MKCTCAHVGHCVFGDQPLVQTYADGSKVFRQLTPKEEAAASDPKAMRAGDFCASVDSKTRTVARAIDGARSMARAQAVQGRVCRADSFMWRLRHKVPEEDTRYTQAQADAFQAAFDAEGTE